MKSVDSVQKKRSALSVIAKTTLAVVVIVFLLLMVIIKPGAPKEIMLLTGPEGGGYHQLGLQYQAALVQSGLPARVIATAGGLDNLGMISNGSHNRVAFVPSNLENAAGDRVDSSGLESLGSVAYEPLWVFQRSELDISAIQEMEGLRVMAGADGSVSAFVAEELFEVNGIVDRVTHVDGELGGPQAVDKAVVDDVFDVAVVTGPPDSPIVHTMLNSEGLTLVSFRRADAYAALLPGLTKMSAVEGVFDLANNLPSEDLELLASTTNLVAHKDLHPAVVPFVLRAASQVHSQDSMFGNTLDFPTKQGASLPLALTAVGYYNHGESGLSKHFPYEVKRWLDHLGLVVLPLFAGAIFLVKFVPIALNIWIKLRLKRLYKRLDAVERADAARQPKSELLAELQKIDDASATIFIPGSKLPEYIDFRQFMHDMRDRISTGVDHDLDESNS